MRIIQFIAVVLVIMVVSTQLCCTAINVQKKGDRSTPTPPPLPRQLNFNDQGVFKLLQFTDLHYGEADWKDYMSQYVQRKLIKTEPNVDLVVLTGDCVSGYAWNGEEGWLAEKWMNMVTPMVEENIRWAMALGNHDDEADLNRTEIVRFDQSYNLSLTELGPSHLHGATNYYLPVYDVNGVMQLILYFFDSNDNACQGVEGWGCVYPDQINWYQQTSAMLQQKNGRIVPALAFMHIPVPEYLDMWNFYPVNGSLEDTGVCCFSVNTGLYAAFKEMGDVIGAYCGHDHDNDFIGDFNGVQLGYGRKTGYGGYGPPIGWLHGGRVIEVTLQPTFKLNTWLRFDDGSTETTQVFHSPSQSQQWNTCCDSPGFIDNVVSQCKRYEQEFIAMNPGRGPRNTTSSH